MAHLSKKDPLYPFYQPTEPTRSFSCGRGYPVRYDMTTLSKAYNTGVFQRSRHQKHRLRSEHRTQSENLHRKDLIEAVDTLKHRFTELILDEKELVDMFAAQEPYSELYKLVYSGRQPEVTRFKPDKYYDYRPEDVGKDTFNKNVGDVVSPYDYSAYISLFEADWCGEPIPMTQDGTEPVSFLHQREHRTELARKLRALHIRYKIPMYQGWKWGEWTVDKWNDPIKEFEPRKLTNRRPILYRKELVHLLTHTEVPIDELLPMSWKPSLRDIENAAYDYGLYDDDCYPYLKPKRLGNPLDYLAYLEARLAEGKKKLNNEEIYDLNDKFPTLARKYGLVKSYLEDYSDSRRLYRDDWKPKYFRR